MLGTEVIKLNREMSFDDVQKLISEKWNPEPFGAFAPQKGSAFAGFGIAQESGLSNHAECKKE